MAFYCKDCGKEFLPEYKCTCLDYLKKKEEPIQPDSKKVVEKLRVINLIAGPGAGKSTTAAGVFFKLKSQDINCELVTEFAKEKVWDRHLTALDDQIYLMANQFHRLFRLIGQVEVAITDSPVVLTWYYNNKDQAKGKMGDAISDLVIAMYDFFDNTNYFLVRQKKFNPKGRVHTEEESRHIDQVMLKVLDERKIPYKSISGRGAADIIAEEYLKGRLQWSKK